MSHGTVKKTVSNRGPGARSETTSIPTRVHTLAAGS